MHPDSENEYQERRRGDAGAKVSTRVGEQGLIEWAGVRQNEQELYNMLQCPLVILCTIAHWPFKSDHLLEGPHDPFRDHRP